MTILQTGRYNEILDKRGAQGSLCGMDSEFIKTDAGRKRELWVPQLERIFPMGPDSTELVILEFTAREGTFCFAGRVEDCAL